MNKDDTLRKNPQLDGDMLQESIDLTRKLREMGRKKKPFGLALPGQYRIRVADGAVWAPEVSAHPPGKPRSAHSWPSIGPNSLHRRFSSPCRPTVPRTHCTSRAVRLPSVPPACASRPPRSDWMRGRIPGAKIRIPKNRRAFRYPIRIRCVV